MAWRLEDTDAGRDLVWDGVENGIGPSPTKGTANIQNANISTETGEALASYTRTAQQQVPITGGTITPVDATLLNAPANLKAGDWITLTGSTISGLPDNTTPITSVAIDYLIVAGGGGGGAAFGGQAGGGGGGAGEMVEDTGNVSVGTYAITIGQGGEGGILAAGQNGQDSEIDTIDSALGGGGGGYGQTSGYDGLAGGSGGGGGGTQGGTAGTGGTAAAGGNIGGNGYQDGTDGAGGGGGGAGSAGSNGTNSGTGRGGNGGQALATTILGTPNVYFAAGGGAGGGSTGGAGGGASNAPGGAGDGGGGAQNGTDAEANTGSGGGGAGSTGASVNLGGAGGSGIVVISYPTGSMLATGGNMSIVGANTVHVFYEDGVFEVLSIVSPGNYYVSYKNASNQIKLSEHYDPYAEHPITHGTTGSATFNTLAVPNAAIAKAYEKYSTATGTEYRYYMLDANGYVWVYDTGVYDYSLATWGVGTQWMLPDPTDYSSFGFNGMSILNGWCMVVSHAYLYGKPTTDLGRFFYALPNAALNNPLGNHKNYAMTGHQGKMYYTDGNYIGSLFPTTSFETNVANIQSFSKYSADGTMGTFDAIIGGSMPYDPTLNTRIPAVFFTDQYGTLPTAITEGVVYYIAVNVTAQNFQVYANITGGVPLDIDTGATGNQYFNTFYPLGLHAGIDGDHSLVTWSGQRVNLPYFELATCMVELDNTVLIGGVTNTLYPWNQVDATPSGFIPLPESGVVAMENVNNTAYILAGNKANIYISNGSVASHALKVPDYCAGVPGTPLTYIEPSFTWGDIAYVRGRVYFSILDQTATKAGNTGGVWSFLPTENFSSDDAALALRLENQNSYGDYDGMARLILPNQVQRAISPQYWSFWQDSYSTGTSSFGIDYTGTVPVTTFIIETDLLATGTFLDKETFQQLEYKLTSEMVAGDSVAMYYRLNATDAWSDSMTIIEEADNRLSGYVEVGFQKTQWVQFRIVCTTTGTTGSSFVRLKQLMLR